MRAVPIGTSRLHEPMSLLPSEDVGFLGCGYVHTSGQVLNLLQVLAGERQLTPSEARWFFRRDQTPPNPFSMDLWQAQPHLDAAIERMRDTWMSSTACFIEICSPRSYRLGDLHVQGNPNIDRNVGYAEIWKQGYYLTYEPDLDVKMFDESVDEIASNLSVIFDLLARQERSAVLMGHLVDPNDPHPGRARNNANLEEAFTATSHGAVAFVDCSPFVAEHGFRVLEDGKVDIHHLPWTALDAFAQHLGEALSSVSK